MDSNPSASKQLLEGPHRHPGQLPRFAEGELTLLKQQDGEFTLHLLWGHTGSMQDFLGNFDRYCQRHGSPPLLGLCIQRWVTEQKPTHNIPLEVLVIQLP